MNALELKSRRKEKKLTQDQLAELLGVDRRTIINYEKGEVIPESKVKLIDIVLKDFENNNDNKLGVPYYDVDFTASFVVVENSIQTQPTSYISHPFFKGCDYVVRASGQSMAKVIAHGDAVGLKKLNNWREFFPFGEVYAIVTNDDIRTIKVITKGETEDTYTLISKPTDGKKDEFPPQQIKRSSILSIFKVQASSHLF
jgi:DNA-binding XRE family transcriptional regulator